MGGVARALASPLGIIDRDLGRTVLQVVAVVATFIPGGQPVAAMAALALATVYKPKSPKPPTAENPIKSPLPPRVSGYGRSGLFAAYILYETATDGTAVDIFAVHDGSIDAIETRYLGDDKVTLTGAVVNEGTDKRYRGGVVSWYETLGASPGTAAFPAILALLPGKWTANHRGDGVVIVATTWKAVKADKYNEAYPQQGPTPIRVVARWQRVFDWRDVTQSVSDPATWKWSENVILQLAHYCLVREKARTSSAQVVPSGAALLAAWNRYFAPTVAYWTAAANICDEAVPVKTGGTEARYRSCLTHKATDPHKATKENLLACCDGWMASRPDGALIVYAGKLYEPTVSIGPEQIVSFSWQEGVEDESSINELTVSYTSSAHDFHTVETTPWSDASDILARGQVRSQPLENPVPSHGQARRLAKRLHARTMAPHRGSVTTNVAGRIARGHRYINLLLEEAGAVFFDGPVEITQITRNMTTGGYTFAWVAVDPGIDSWNPATEEGDPAATGERVASEPVATPVITAVTPSYGSDSGAGTPGVRLTVQITGPARDDLAWQLQWRKTGDTAWISRSYPDVDPGLGVSLVTEFVPADTSVDVQVAYVLGDGRPSDWSATAVVNTAVPMTYDPINLFFAANAGGWYDISDLSSLFQDVAAATPAAVGSGVARVNDKSGRGNHLVQPTAADRPILQQDSNGKYYLAFNGVNQWLSATFVLAQPWTRISAVRQVAWTNGRRLFGNPSGSNVALVYQHNASPGLSLYDGTTVGPTNGLAVGVNGVLREVHNDAASSISINNGAAVTGASGATAATGLGVARDVTATHANMRLYGLIMIGRLLTTEETAAVRTYFAGKANVAL